MQSHYWQRFSGDVVESFNNECRIILGCMYYGFIIAFIYNFVIILRERFKRHYILDADLTDKADKL